MAAATDTEVTYRLINERIGQMTEDELAAEIDRELNGDRRSDMLARLVGRFNRLRGKRVKQQVFAAIGNQDPKKSKSIDEVLDRHR